MSGGVVSLLEVRTEELHALAAEIHDLDLAIAAAEAAGGPGFRGKAGADEAAFMAGFLPELKAERARLWPRFMACAARVDHLRARPANPDSPPRPRPAAVEPANAPGWHDPFRDGSGI